MKGKLLVAIIALSFGGFVNAQNSTMQSSGTPQSNSSSNDTEKHGDSSGQADGTTGTVNGSPPGTSAARMGGQTGDDAGLGASKAGSFDSMDRQHRGYLMPTDVSSNKQLSSKFAACDKNHDGRLSRDEYNGCASSQ